MYTLLIKKYFFRLCFDYEKIFSYNFLDESTFSYSFMFLCKVQYFERIQIRRFCKIKKFYIFF